MSDFKIINFPTHDDVRGRLVVLQEKLPFVPQRFFWISQADGQTRGGHRHHLTRQGLVAVTGQVDILMNDGTHKETIVLAHPGHCLIVEPEDWHTMTFHPGSVLLVFASQHYDRNDYIDEGYDDRV